MPNPQGGPERSGGGRIIDHTLPVPMTLVVAALEAGGPKPSCVQGPSWCVPAQRADERENFMSRPVASLFPLVVVAVIAALLGPSRGTPRRSPDG